jgi:hypothetical protein
MNSNYAATAVRTRPGGQPAAIAQGFSAMVGRQVAEEDRLPAPGTEGEAAAALEQPGQAQTQTEPAEPPVRSRTSEAGETAGAPGPRSSVPHFTEVALALRYPDGPYRQAPEEFGGEWWLTNPFTGLEPWKTQGFLDPYAPQAVDNAGASEGFLAVFGPRPNRETHPNLALRGAAAADWERNLESFKGVGIPEGYTQQDIDAASKVYEACGLGKPLFYEGRYGWAAKFPESKVQGFEPSPFVALEVPHLVVARYQVELAGQGLEPARKHPFVPPQVFGGEPLNA